MKKILIAMLIATFIFAGCGKEVPEETTPVSEEKVTEEKTLQDKEIKESDYRPIALMIDNDNNDSRPHAGLGDAYLLYEMYVEGSATRIMALFKDTDTKKIGPIRSSRHYFLDYALDNDALYVHFGWSPQAQNDIPALGINNINGVLGSDGNVFWRERKYAGDYHSAYTSIAKIRDHAENVKKYRLTTDKQSLRRYEEEKAIEGGTALTELTLPYAGFYTVKYTYDEAEKTYKRYLNGQGHITQEKVHLAAKNIIVQIASNYGISGDDKGRQNIQTTGSGEGYYITGGVAKKITWEKKSRTDKTVYKYEDGSDLILNPGQTWIQIVPPSMTLGI